MKTPKLLLLLLSCWVALVTPANATLNGSVQCNDNAASQPAPTNNLQAEIDSVIPPAPSRFKLQADRQGLVSSVAMDQFSQPRIQPQQAVMIHLLPKRHQLQGTMQHELSCIGMIWNMNTGKVLYVDKNSDLCTKVFQGDIYVTLNGVPAWPARLERLNFGSEQTPMTLRFVQHGMARDYVCMRHPISWFSPWFQQNLKDCGY